MDFETFARNLAIPLHVTWDNKLDRWVARILQGMIEEEPGVYQYPVQVGTTYREALEALGAELEGKTLYIGALSNPIVIEIPPGFEGAVNEEEGFFVLLAGERQDVVNVNLTQYVPTITIGDGRKFELYSYRSTWKDAVDAVASPALRRLLSRNIEAAYEVNRSYKKKEDSCSTSS